MDTEARAYLALVVLLAVACAALIRATLAANRRAEKWRRRAHRADCRADAWRRRAERAHGDQLIDTALTDNAMELYKRLEERS